MRTVQRSTACDAFFRTAEPNAKLVLTPRALARSGAPCVGDARPWLCDHNGVPKEEADVDEDEEEEEAHGEADEHNDEERGEDDDADADEEDAVEEDEDEEGKWL